MSRPSNPVMDAEIGRQHKVLDHGMIRVVDYMGDDAAVVQAARVSYGAGTTTPSDDRSLIRYLMSHRHSTPFEMCEIKLHVKLPIFVARYSILANEFYIPEARDIMPQSKTNKQGREGELPEDVRRAMLETIRQQSEMAYQVYEELHTGWPWFDESGCLKPGHVDPDDTGPHEGQFGMAREMARMVVPTNVYTEWYWKVDLHNLLHFLSLRADPHAQMEIRVYAEVICDLLRQWVPNTFEAFEDYVMRAQRFSRMEMEVLRALAEKACQNTAPNFLKDLVSLGDLNVRERRELIAKLGLADD